MGDKRRRKQEKRARRGGRVKRPRGQGSSAAATNRLERELSNPEKFTAHLERFRELAVEDEALEPFGIPSAQLIPLLLGTAEVGPAPLPKDGDLSDAVLPHLAEPALAEALSHVLAEAHDAMADRGAPESDLLAVLAATALAEDCVEGPEDGEEDASGEAHPFWGVVFDVAFTRAVGSGALVGHAVADPAALPTREALAARLATALQGEPLRAALATAKVAAPAPMLLAETLLEVLADDELVPSFGVETALEGLRVQRQLIDDLVPRLVREGPSKAWTSELQALASAAYAADPVGEVVGELREGLLGALAESAGEGEADRLPLVAMVAALDAYPPAESPLLRRAWAQTISTPALDEAEEPLAIAVWQAPADPAALEALERHLQKSAPERAARVARYRARHPAT